MSASAPRMAKIPPEIGSGISRAVEIILGPKPRGKKKSGSKRRKPVILTHSIRLVKGSLRKNACRNRNTPTGVMCGSVWRTETRTLAGRLVKIQCLICRDVKKITKLGERLEQRGKKK